MRDTGHLPVAKGDIANKNLIPNFTVLLLLLCLAGLSACGATSQGASAPASGSVGQLTPAGQLRISFPSAQATVGVAYNAVPSVSGEAAPYVFRIADGSLPSGLVLNPNTGSITGTPSVAGTYNFVIYVSTLRRKEYGAGPAHIVVSDSASAIRLSISPSLTTIFSQGHQQFTAQLSGTANTGVVWSASVGTISSNGAFVAPEQERFLFLLFALRATFEEHRAGAGGRTLSDLDCLQEISCRKAPPAAQKVLRQAANIWDRYHGLVTHFEEQAAIARLFGETTEIEKIMLASSISFECENNKTNPQWSLRTGGLNRINEHFFFLDEYFQGTNGACFAMLCEQ